MKSKITLILLVLISSAGLSACGSSSDYTAYNSINSSAQKNDYTEEFGSTQDYNEENSITSGELDLTKLESTELNLKVIKEGQIDIETSNYEKTYEEVLKKIKEYNGFVFSLDKNDNGIDRYSNISIKVPNQKFESFMNEEIKNGSVKHSNIYTQDITSEYVDTENRIKSLQTRYDKLLELMEKAVELEDLFKIENELAKVNYELETYQGTLSGYDSLVNYSTITLFIDEVEKIIYKEEDYKFINRVTNNVKNTYNTSIKTLQNIFVYILTILIYTTIILLPMMLIISIVLFVVIKIVKKKQKEKRLKLNKEIEEKNKDL